MSLMGWSIMSMSLGSQPAENTMRTLGTRLREGRKMRRMTQTQLAKLIRKSPNQVSMIENGQSGTSIRTMVAAASALNVSLDFLGGLSEDPTPSRELLFEMRRDRAYMRDLEQGKSALSLMTYDSSAHIEVTDIHTAAGAGAVVHGEAVKSMIEFPRSWLRERGLQPKKCRVIGVVGEYSSASGDPGGEHPRPEYICIPQCSRSGRSETWKIPAAVSL